MNVGVSYRELLPPNVAEELETMSARIRQSWFVEHDPDGHHGDVTARSFQATGLIAAGSDPLAGTQSSFTKAGRFVYLSNSRSEAVASVSSIIQQLESTTGSAQGLGGASRAAHASGAVTLLIGTTGQASVLGQGSVTAMRGLNGIVFTESGAGGATDAMAVRADVVGRVSGSGTITNGYGVYISHGSTGITNKYGVFVADATARNIINQAEFADGTAGTPSIRFINDPDTGIFRVGSNTIGLSTAGTNRWQIDGSGNVTHSGNVLQVNTVVGGVTYDLRNLSNNAAATTAVELFNDVGVKSQFLVFSSAGAFPNATFLVGVNNLELQSNAGIIYMRPGGARTARWLAAGHYVVDELTTNPGTADLAADAAVAIYTKADTLVFAYNNGGTMTYIKIPLDGSTTTWTHNTTAP